MSIAEERNRVYRQGEAAWKRVKKEQNWNDWMMIGEALDLGREEIKDQLGLSGINKRRLGRGFNVAFSAWKEEHGFSDMDDHTASDLMELIAKRPEFESWRSRLPKEQRLRWNHPSTMLRNWKRLTELPNKKKAGEQKPTLRESVAKLDEANATKDCEIASLKEHIAELEAARHSDPVSADAWIAALEGKSYAEKAAALYELMLRLDLRFSHLRDAHLAAARAKREKPKGTPETAGSFNKHGVFIPAGEQNNEG
jgi:hypothetical protein